jgi:hypothetical protein
MVNRSLDTLYKTTSSEGPPEDLCPFLPTTKLPRLAAGDMVDQNAGFFSFDHTIS